MPMATGNPTASAISDRFARSRRCWTIATLIAASGPNSGPTTIAPMMRIGESCMTPTEAISVAMIMNARNDAESSVSSAGARLDLFPDDGVRGQSLGRLLGLLRGVRDRGIDLLERDRAAVVDVERAQVGDDDAGVLARDVALDHVA